MSARIRARRRILLASALGLALPAAALAQCPPAGQLATTIQEVFKRPGIQVKSVKPAAIKGLCEVLIAVQRQGSVLYTDTTGAHFIANGVLIENKSGKNLTEEALIGLKEELDALNVIAPQDLKKLDDLAAVSLGTKGPTVYFATDPL